MFDNSRQTLNKIILILCRICRGKKKYLSTFSFDKVSPNFRLYNGSPNTLPICMHMRHEVNGTLENNRALAGNTHRSVCVCAYVYAYTANARLSRRSEWNGIIFEFSFVALHCYMRPLREGMFGEPNSISS